MCRRDALTQRARRSILSANARLQEPRSVDQNAGQEERESQSNQRAIERSTGSVAIAMSRKKARFFEFPKMGEKVIILYLS